MTQSATQAQRLAAIIARELKQIPALESEAGVFDDLCRANTRPDIQSLTALCVERARVLVAWLSVRNKTELRSIVLIFRDLKK